MLYDIVGQGSVSGYREKGYELKLVEFSCSFLLKREQRHRNL